MRLFFGREKRLWMTETTGSRTPRAHAHTTT
jgi:hypothetical protein